MRDKGFVLELFDSSVVLSGRCASLKVGRIYKFEGPV